MPKTAVTQKPKISDEEAAICERMRSRRIALGIPQKELAKRMGVSLDTLRSYEYARAPVRYGFADHFCDEMDVNQRWLYSGSLPKRPYVRISTIWTQFIPQDMHFSKVAKHLLASLIEEALVEIAREVGGNCSLEEMDRWDSFPWTPMVGLTASGVRDRILHVAKMSLAHAINRIPQELWATLEKEHSAFLNAFQKRYQKKILEHLAEDPMATHIEDEARARAVVAARLKLDPVRLAKISMLGRPRSRGR